MTSTNDRLTTLINKAKNDELTNQELLALHQLLNRLLVYVDDELYCKDVRK